MLKLRSVVSERAAIRRVQVLAACVHCPIAAAPGLVVRRTVLLQGCLTVQMGSSSLHQLRRTVAAAPWQGHSQVLQLTSSLPLSGWPHYIREGMPDAGQLL